MYQNLVILYRLFSQRGDQLCCCSVAQCCPTHCDPMDCSLLGCPVLHHLPKSAKLMSIESVMPSDHLTLCRPLLLLPSIFPSIRVFFSELALHIRWSKYWSFSFSLLSDLIFFKHLVPHILQTFADKSRKKELFHLGTADILDRIFLCHWQYVCVADDGVCLLQHVLAALLEKNCLQCGRPGFNPWVG